MAQGLQKLTSNSNPKGQGSKHLAKAKKEGKRGVKINPKRSSALVSKHINAKLSSKIHKRIEEDAISKARSLDNLQILSKKK